MSEKKRVSIATIPGFTPQNGHNEQTLVSQETPAHIAIYSDGLPFDPNRTGEQLQRLYVRIMGDFIEIGKYLIWASCEMNSEGFSEWLEQYFPESRTAANRYMKIARRVLESKDQNQVRSFLESVGKGKSTKMLSVLYVSDEEVEEALDTGEFLSRPIEEVGSMSVRQMKEELQRKDVALKHATERRRELEDELVAERQKSTDRIKPSETEQRVTSVVMAMGRLTVHLEGLPIAERLEKAEEILAPIQSHFDQVVAACGQMWAGGDDE